MMIGSNWPHYRDRVTVADVLDAGACLDGVVEWVEKHNGQIAGNTADHVRNDYIRTAANADGYGNGYGYGDGYGNGDGYGYGYGYGNGYGYGYGYGDGYGNGNGYGDGGSQE